MEESPGPEVWVILGGGAIWFGLGCGGDGGVGQTLVAYLREAGAGAAGIVEATTTIVAAGMAGAFWLVAVATVGGCAAAAAAIVGGGAVAATATVSGPGPKAVASTCLNHAWSGEGKEMEGMGG